MRKTHKRTQSRYLWGKPTRKAHEDDLQGASKISSHRGHAPTERRLAVAALVMMATLLAALAWLLSLGCQAPWIMAGGSSYISPTFGASNGVPPVIIVAGAGAVAAQTHDNSPLDARGSSVTPQTRSVWRVIGWTALAVIVVAAMAFFVLTRYRLGLVK